MRPLTLQQPSTQLTATKDQCSRCSACSAAPRARRAPHAMTEASRRGEALAEQLRKGTVKAVTSRPDQAPAKDWVLSWSCAQPWRDVGGTCGHEAYTNRSRKKVVVLVDDIQREKGRDEIISAGYRLRLMRPWQAPRNGSGGCELRRSLVSPHTFVRALARRARLPRTFAGAMLFVVDAGSAVSRNDWNPSGEQYLSWSGGPAACFPQPPRLPAAASPPSLTLVEPTRATIPTVRTYASDFVFHTPSRDGCRDIIRLL
jgi:hypothetical protein